MRFFSIPQPRATRPPSASLRLGSLAWRCGWATSVLLGGLLGKSGVEDLERLVGGLLEEPLRPFDGSVLVDGCRLVGGPCLFGVVDAEELDEVGVCAFGDAASEPSDEVLAMGLEQDLLAALGTRQEEVAEVLLQRRVELGPRLL